MSTPDASLSASRLSRTPTLVEPNEDRHERDADTVTLTPPLEEAPAIVSESAELEQHYGVKKDAGFWMIILSLCVTSWLAAIDLTSVSTALPTIVDDLHGGSDFVWVGSAFTLASTAILPLSGNIATIFGRQFSVLSFIFLFAVGSAITGSAQNMPAMIAGRTIQGLGGGGILSLAEIIVADLVPLRERGMYQGILGSVWAFASAIGPPIGGGLAQAGQWRWLFYLNLPLCAIAFGLTFAFLKLKRPPGSMREKLARIDWIGNIMIIIASTLAIVALVEGGITHPWNSYQILVPLIVGIVGIGIFLVYESYWVIGEPMVPFDIFSNRTSLSGYAGNFMHGVTSIILIYYLPVYFQSTMLASPVRSSIQLFPSAFIIAPVAIIVGISVAATDHYVTQNVVAWMLCMIGYGLITTLTKDSSTGTWVGYQIVAATGVGILFPATTFPVLAPLPITKTAHALAFYTFLRTFGQTFGVTIGATVLQNELSRKLPSAFSALFPAGVNIAYAAIPQIPTLPQPLQDQVRVAFATSLSTMWKVTLGLAGAGLATTFFMKQIHLHVETDDQWGRDGKQETGDAEKALTLKTQASA
ncbi:MFS general substrate transporter [Dacryopinax primogenitus]|uniref:MFS general substrate transporter n=1 Tax=Dacryopinax primogenitus (strain DJM 731) TaxID=1858805 RepID=M5FU91_DACPD|nr:MFS general substrate transporter [Dacryopinax primogenitus]EJU01276.1 MFS general substrate transporter [Dacryopinax primogenitus]